ncbi:hypothetical protein [Roseovarius sp.]|uniref:hypothetical protein n=1 Tax=Roseovarius sp. TaxID=1486281 RepID=UPI003A96FB92
MKRFIRAEDFSVDEFRIVLGGRILEGGSIVSAHIERRVSAELLGICSLIMLSVTALGLWDTRQPIIVAIILVILGLGAYWEVKRAWVLVLNIYQLGGFEVRGFTHLEGTVALELVDGLRGRPGTAAGARAAHNSRNHF